MNNSTRTYPRTLKDDFRGADYGCSIERSRPADRAVNWALLISVIVIIFSIIYQAQP